MKLQSVKIGNFRSVREIELIGCGGFNVLVGKNNSGKSNLLAAIFGFFQCLASGQAVNAKIRLGADLDFHERQTSEPIEIDTAVRLTLGSGRYVTDNT